MTSSYDAIVSQKNKKRNPFVSELRFLFGGDGEIISKRKAFLFTRTFSKLLHHLDTLGDALAKKKVACTLCDGSTRCVFGATHRAR